MTANKTALDLVDRKVKIAIDRYMDLHDVPVVFNRARYRKIGGMKLLEKDRRMAKNAMHREFARLGRLTLVRSRMKPPTT